MNKNELISVCEINQYIIHITLKISRFFTSNMSFHIYTLLPGVGDDVILMVISIECKFISNLIIQSKCGMVETFFI